MTTCQSPSKNSWIGTYAGKRCVIAFIISSMAGALSAYLGVPDQTTFRSAAPNFVTLGITLGGFFLTALSILMAVSNVGIMKRMLRMPKSFGQLTDLFAVTVAANTLLGLFAICYSMVPKTSVKVSLCLTGLQMCFFWFSVYFTYLSLENLFEVIRKITGNSE